MNIIIHRYGSICEPDLIEAFNACGIAVIEDSTEIYQKSISSEARIRLLGELILTHKPAFVFSINFFPYISEICEKLHVLYVSLSVDCPVLELFSLSIRNKCNRIFLFDYMQYQKFYPKNPEGIFYLPLASNTNRWEQALSSVSQKERELYDCDISFVGSLYKEKSPLQSLSLSNFDRGLADGIIEAQLKVPGCSLLEEAPPNSLLAAVRKADSAFFKPENCFTDTDSYVLSHYYLGMEASALERIRTLQELGREFSVNLYTRSDTSDLQNISGIRCCGGVSTHSEMPLVFRFSKINLNITMRSIQSGLSQRIWDILGCGGFLISNYQSEIPEYFTIGEDLECYENLNELKEKIAFYLAHDDIRNKIAQNGLKKTREQHTYIHRVLQIMKTLFAASEAP
ncbi:MAG: glycosyltransferase [Clostridium sp.]|nr:glycosyltransferase [Clostridium sp.]